jgi:hypothetical protein
MRQKFRALQDRLNKPKAPSAFAEITTVNGTKLKIAKTKPGKWTVSSGPNVIASPDHKGTFNEKQVFELVSAICAKLPELDDDAKREMKLGETLTACGCKRPPMPNYGMRPPGMRFETKAERDARLAQSYRRALSPENALRI